jgi:hypothetical protein
LWFSVEHVGLPSVMMCVEHVGLPSVMMCVDRGEVRCYGLSKA